MGSRGGSHACASLSCGSEDESAHLNWRRNCTLEAWREEAGQREMMKKKNSTVPRPPILSKRPAPRGLELFFQSGPFPHFFLHLFCVIRLSSQGNFRPSAITITPSGSGEGGAHLALEFA